MEIIIFPSSFLRNTPCVSHPHKSIRKIIQSELFSSIRCVSFLMRQISNQKFNAKLPIRYPVGWNLLDPVEIRLNIRDPVNFNLVLPQSLLQIFYRICSEQWSTNFLGIAPTLSVLIVFFEKINERIRLRYGSRKHLQLKTID